MTARTALGVGYGAHVRALLGRLGACAAMPFLSWFIRDRQRAGIHTHTHTESFYWLD